jgi:CheY-like chemotaxis protein/HPt (histidine-containing phosphotransfer) domain-containing protein
MFFSYLIGCERLALFFCSIEIILIQRCKSNPRLYSGVQFSIDGKVCSINRADLQDRFANFDPVKSQLSYMRAQLLGELSQCVLLDEVGMVLESDGVPDWVHPGDSPVFERYPIPEEVQTRIQALSPGDSVWWRGVAVAFGEARGVYDMAFARERESWFWLILELGEGAPVREHWHRQSGVARERDPEAGLNILVAEDNPFNLKVTLRQLDRMGFRYRAVVNGKEAVDALREQHYDAVLMDLNMPVLGGVEACARIRTELPGALAQTPVIAMSSSGLTEADPGFDAVLKKPVRSELLQQTIVRVTRARAQDDSGVPAPLVRLDYLHEVTQGSRELMVELMDIYLKEVPGAVEQLHFLVTRQEWRTLRELAHKTKANFRYVGADQMFALADTIERYAASGSMVDRIPKVMQELQAQVAPTAEALKKLRHELISGPDTSDAKERSGQT